MPCSFRRIASIAASWYHRGSCPTYRGNRVHASPSLRASATS